MTAEDFAQWTRFYEIQLANHSCTAAAAKINADAAYLEWVSVRNGEVPHSRAAGSAQAPRGSEAT